MGSSQTVLSFQLAGTDESLTAQGGLALFGEYLHGLGVGDLIDRELVEERMRTIAQADVGDADFRHVTSLQPALRGARRLLGQRGPRRRS